MQKDSQTEAQKPWYKHFWPWFIMAIPGSSVIAGIAMIIVANDGADTLVKENYYKEGLAINQHIEKLNHAKELAISAVATINKDKLELKINANSAINEQLFIEFRHATQADKDFKIALQRSASGDYFAFIDEQQGLQQRNKWYLTLKPFSERWELESNWHYPVTSTANFGL